LALAAAVPACAIVAWWFAPELLLKFWESGGAPEMAGDPATTGAPRAGGESPQEISQSDPMEATPGLDSPTESAGGGLDRSPTGQPLGEDGNREKGSFADVFAGGAAKTDGPTAFAALFQYWGLAYDEGPGSNACGRAAAAGLRCLYGKGNWTTLAHYDRPAVLELIDRDDRQHHVVAAQLAEKQVTLDFGGRKMTVAKEDVDPYWFGDFILLWKPPPFDASLLRQGHSGPEIRWLREQLDRADNDSPGAPGEAASPLFDSELKERVIDFQRSHALRPDGVVGEQTFIQLQAAVQDPLIPALKQRPQ
jgi:general secretion pathway protein A